MTTGVKTFAPWTDEQVAKMNEWQACRRVNELTCQEQHRSARLGKLPRTKTLVATREGMVCPSCGYTQHWALASMLNGTPGPQLFRRPK